MRIAIVHDWLTNYGGAERVIEAMHELFPQAPIYTSVYNPDKLPSSFKNMDIRTSFIQKFPFAKTKYKTYLPFMPQAFEDMDLGAYDVVISNSHACAKGIIVKPQTLHISYVHTPMRYAWDFYHDYMRFEKISGLKRIIINSIMSYLRLWDRLSAERPDFIMANSHNIRRKIKKYYSRNSEVLYPPVETALFKPLANPSLDYYLVASRLVPYKRVDIAVEAFNKLGFKLKIVGSGSDFKKLRKMAKNNIEFSGKTSDEELKNLYANCKALIFPGEEDFGIVPLEAQASGRPVIGYAKGGLLETVIDRQTGIFFMEQTVDSLINAVNEFENLKFDPVIIRNNALKFDTGVFKDNLKKLLDSYLQSPRV